MEGWGRNETIQRQYAIRLQSPDTLMRTATLVEKWEGTEIRVPLKNLRKILWSKCVLCFLHVRRPHIDVEHPTYLSRAEQWPISSWNYLFQTPASQEASSKSSRSD